MPNIQIYFLDALKLNLSSHIPVSDRNQPEIADVFGKARDLAP